VIFALARRWLVTGIRGWVEFSLPAVENEQLNMNYALVRRIVTDVAKWRAAYAEYAPKRAEAGLTDTMVLYSVDNPNEVWTLHGAGDVATLRQFEKTIRPAMQQTGLQDAPDFHYLTD
jgi:hypothetical protein